MHTCTLARIPSTPLTQRHDRPLQERAQYRKSAMKTPTRAHVRSDVPSHVPSHARSQCALGAHVPDARCIHGHCIACTCALRVACLLTDTYRSPASRAICMSEHILRDCAVRMYAITPVRVDVRDEARALCTHWCRCIVYVVFAHVHCVRVGYASDTHRRAVLVRRARC